MANSENKNELYKKMYYRLFNRVTDALEKDSLSEIKFLLKKAQVETEEIFIKDGE